MKVLSFFFLFLGIRNLKRQCKKIFFKFFFLKKYNINLEKSVFKKCILYIVKFKFVKLNDDNILDMIFFYLYEDFKMFILYLKKMNLIQGFMLMWLMLVGFFIV